MNENITFREYTSVLASLGIITWKQADQIEADLASIEHQKAEAIQQFDRDFFDKEWP